MDDWLPFRWTAGPVDWGADRPTTVDGGTDKPTAVDRGADRPTTVDGGTDRPTAVDGGTDEPTAVDRGTDRPTTVDGGTDKPTAVDRRTGGSDILSTAVDGGTDRPTAVDRRADGSAPAVDRGEWSLALVGTGGLVSAAGEPSGCGGVGGPALGSVGWSMAATRQPTALTSPVAAPSTHSPRPQPRPGRAYPRTPTVKCCPTTWPGCSEESPPTAARPLAWRAGAWTAGACWGQGPAECDRGQAGAARRRESVSVGQATGR